MIYVFLSFGNEKWRMFSVPVCLFAGGKDEKAYQCVIGPSFHNHALHCVGLSHTIP